MDGLHEIYIIFILSDHWYVYTVQWVNFRCQTEKKDEPNKSIWLRFSRSRNKTSWLINMIIDYVCWKLSNLLNTKRCDAWKMNLCISGLDTHLSVWHIRQKIVWKMKRNVNTKHNSLPETRHLKMRNNIPYTHTRYHGII